MAFDIEGARSAGYSTSEIADFLGAENKFDTSAARESGYSDEELIQHLSDIQKPAEETDAQIAARARGELIPEDEGYLKGLYRAGAGAAKSTAGGIMQFAGAEESGREFSKAGQEQGKNYPSVSDIPALYREEGLLSAIKGAGRAIPYDIARTAPVIAAGVGTGALATALAPEAALAGLGAATLAELGVYGISATGENMNRQQAQIDAGTRKDFDRGAAIASGMVQGVLEKVGVNQILGKAGAVGERIAQQLGTKTAAEEILAASTRTGLRTAGRVIGGIAETGAVEGSVEALQEGLGRAQAGESLTDKEALEAYGTAGLGGVLVGGTMRAPFATAEGLSSKDKAIKKIEDFGNVGLDVLSGNVALTPEQFKTNGTLMAEGIARNTTGSEGEKTRDQAFEELKTKVKSQEQFDRELAEKQAGLEGLSQTQLPDEFADEFAGAPRAEVIAEEELSPELKNRRQQDIFKMGDVGPTATLQVTPSGEALLNQEQIDAQDFRRLAEKQHQELIDAGVKSKATEEMGKLLEKTREGSQVDLFGGKKGTLKEEVIPARTQDFGTAPIQEDVVTRAAQQAKATADMSKVVEKTKEGAQVDLFGGKKGTIKEVAIPEAKVAETVAPKQSDIVDEAKQLELPHLLTTLKGLTQTAEGGPHPDTLLGKEPTGQRKTTDFATAVHAEVGAKDTDVITPAHVAEAGVRDLELGKVIEKVGGLPISDPKVSAAINKLTPEKQVALTNVLSKEYSPENYIKPSEMLVSKQELLNLNIPPQSTLVKDLFNKPKVESINVVNNPAGAKQLVTQLVAVSKNKNAPPAVQAAALQKAVTIEQTLAKVKSANNKAVAAKAVTTKGTDTNIVTKDDVVHSVAPTGITTGHTIASLSKALSPELKRLVASGKAVLHDTAATLPGTGHPANVQGMTTADGVTHYVANKLTPSTIQNVALHEVGVHAGMRKMLGDKLWSYVKDQAMTNQGAAFVKARASVPEGTPDHLIAEETLAYLVENSPNLSLVRQIVASIRNFMRSKLGANIRLSEADARQMATAAMRKESKTAERTSREETAFSKEKLLAPNGKPSNLNAMQHAQVRTPEFKKWFGDWENDPKNASKVVDENGEPLVVYHGTDDVRNVFKKGESGALGPGIYTTQRKDHAKVYGTHVQSLYANTKNPLIIEDTGRLDITEAIARDKKFEEENFNSRGAASKWAKDQFEEHAGIGDPEFNIMLSDAGYDGVIYKKGNTFTEMSLQKAYQVKSATENSGAFSSQNPDIRYSVNNGGFNGNVSKFKKIAGSAKEKLPAFLEMFGAAGINSIAGKLLQGVEVNGVPSKNSASEILKQTRKIAGMTNKLLNEYLPIRKEINAYIKKNYRQVPILGDVANEATLLGVSPAEKDINNPNNIQNRIKSELDKGLSGYADRVKRLRALETRFKQLNPESITMYTRLSDYYKKAYQDYTNAELARIDTADLTDTEKDRQRDIFNQQMADTKLRGDYFPVMRFGKYSVEYTDGDIDDVTGELISKFNKFETEAEATAFASNPKIKTKGARLDIERDRSTVLTGNKTIKDMWDNIDRTFKGVKGQKDLDDAINDMKDFVFQMNLMGRPEQSIGKRFLHRKGTPGYANDIFRGFDNYALSMSKQLPRIEMSHGITSKLTKLEKELADTGADKIDAVRYYNAFNKQIINSVYPKQVWDFTNTLTGAVFHYYLTSPISAALQLASIPIQGAPSIAKQHGIKIAQSSLNAATSLYLGSGIGRKTGWWDIKRGAMNHKDIQKFVKGATHAAQLNIPDAVDRMREEALLVPGVHAQAFGGGNKPTKEGNTPFDKAKHVMELTSRPFAEMETASRQIVSVAAYIANIKSGMTHDAAVRKAIDTTYVDMGDYGETGKAAMFKTGFGGLAKVAMQFQQYGAKLLFAMSKAGYDAVKGEDAETKSQARKFLAHTFAMHYVFAGALGLPLIGLVGAATDFVRDLKDDEERHSFKEDLRIALHSENIDDMWINLILNGPVGTITGLDLTDRIGAADLIPMVQESDLNETLKGEVVGKALQSFGGAAASTASNFEKAIDQFTEGNYGKAFEKLLPSSIRNVVTAARYANEGKLTAGGLPIVSKEEISGWDIVARALGAESSHMAEKSKASRSAHMANQFIMDRKKELLDKFAKADPRERQETILEMQRFTRRHPGAAIGMDTIRSSLKSRLMAVHTATRGYQLGKNKAEIKRLFPELEDDTSDDEYDTED